MSLKNQLIWFFLTLVVACDTVLVQPSDVPKHNATNSSTSAPGSGGSGGHSRDSTPAPYPHPPQPTNFPPSPVPLPTPEPSAAINGGSPSPTTNDDRQASGITDDDDRSHTNTKHIFVVVMVSVGVVFAGSAVVVVLLRRRNDQDPSTEVDGTAELQSPSTIRNCDDTSESSTTTSTRTSGASSFGPSCDSSASVTAPPPYVGLHDDGCTKSCGPQVDEEFITTQAQSKTSVFTIPILCAQGHKCEKEVVVTCLHYPNKKPKKATDLKTLFDGTGSGHLWSCAQSSRLTNEEAGRIVPHREMILTVDGQSFPPSRIDNSITAVYQSIASHLEFADSVIASRCSCPPVQQQKANGKGVKSNKIPVEIAMQLIHDEQLPPAPNRSTAANKNDIEMCLLDETDCRSGLRTVDGDHHVRQHFDV